MSRLRATAARVYARGTLTTQLERARRASRRTRPSTCSSAAERPSSSMARVGIEPTTPRFSVAGFTRARNPALADSNRLCKADPGNLHSETIPHVARRRYPQILEVLGGFGRRDRASSPKQGGGILSAQTVNPARRATNEVPTRIRERWLARRQPAAPQEVDHHSRHRPELQRSEPWPEAAPCIAQ